MISVIGSPFPLNGHSFSHFGKFLGLLRLIQHFGQATITGNRHNGFGRKIGIVRQMSRKIFGAQLIFRIHTCLGQIIAPSRQDFPMFCRIVCIPIGNSDRSRHNQHIPRFFHRHISLISLPICQRICTDIVCGKRLFPTARLAIIENEIQHSFHYFCIIPNKNRTRRICHINRTDRPVAVIFLRKKEQLTGGATNQFMSRYSLAIRGCTKFGILLSSGFNSVFHNLIIPLVTSLHGFFIILSGIGQCGFHRRIFFLPIRFQIFPEILYRGNIIITDHQISFGFPFSHIAQIFAIR